MSDDLKRYLKDPEYRRQLVEEDIMWRKYREATTPSGAPETEERELKRTRSTDQRLHTRGRDRGGHEL